MLLAELADWLVEADIPRIHVSKLLKIRKKNNLPADYRALLRTMLSVESRVVELGNYYHFGVASGLLRSLFGLGLAVAPPEVVQVKINIDEIPLAKSTKSQFRFILALKLLTQTIFSRN